MTDDQDRRPASERLIRAATQLGVNFPQRTIELVVMPYDVEAIVDQPYRRMVFESVAPGAFSGIQRRANRIRVNRGHDTERTVGRVTALYPSRPEGLVAELRIARTPLGDETLALADDGCLDASAAVRPMPDGLEWNRDRTKVRLTKLWLEHVAMTPEPAYETANVLAVRTAALEPAAVALVATPLLDQLRADRLRERYDSI